MRRADGNTLRYITAFRRGCKKYSFSSISIEVAFKRWGGLENYKAVPTNKGKRFRYLK
jgi:hypothetical protein